MPVKQALHMPAVSIVTTTFNRTEYLKEAIQSAVSQTFGDFELLVCDDGGLDATRRLCESFHDNRIVHVANPARLGIARNTYAGIMRARSNVIAFLNDDDRWTRDFLAQCAVPLLEDSDAVLAFSDHWLIDSKGVRLLDATDANTREYGRDVLTAGKVDCPARLMVRLSVPMAMAAVFRRSKVDWDNYSEKVEGAYDSYIAYSLLRNKGKVIYIPRRLTEYRTHSGAASAEFHRDTTEGLAHVYGLILKDPTYRIVAEEIRKKYIAFERHLVKLSLAEQDFRSTMAHCARLIYTEIFSAG